MNVIDKSIIAFRVIDIGILKPKRINSILVELMR